MSLLACMTLLSCSPSESIIAPTDTRSLTTEISRLKIENAELRGEIALLKAGGTPMPISDTPMGGMMGEDATYTDGNLQTCMQEAFVAYRDQGSKLCRDAGYNDKDINENKCQLDQKVITDLANFRKLTEENCTSLYK